MHIKCAINIVIGSVSVCSNGSLFSDPSSVCWLAAVGSLACSVFISRWRQGQNPSKKKSFKILHVKIIIFTWINSSSSYLLTFWVSNFLWTFAVRQPTSALSLHSWDVEVQNCSSHKSCWRVKASLSVWQERESAAGSGGELWAGPDLHHRENYCHLLPKRCGGAELRCQPAGGRDHAALQTWTKLPGTLPCEHTGDSSRDVGLNRWN